MLESYSGKIGMVWTKVPFSYGFLHFMAKDEDDKFGRMCVEGEPLKCHLGIVEGEE